MIYLSVAMFFVAECVLRHSLEDGTRIVWLWCVAVSSSALA